MVSAGAHSAASASKAGIEILRFMNEALPEETPQYTVASCAVPSHRSLRVPVRDGLLRRHALRMDLGGFVVEHELQQPFTG